MKLQKMVMAAALTVTISVGVSAMESPPSSNPDHASQPKESSEPDRKPTREKGHKSAKTMLEPEYKAIRIFSDFRKKLIEDGWVPVPDPDCHDTVLGGYYDEYCSEVPGAISCRLCAMVPETWKSTSDGYTLTRYEKGGVPLSVTAYGDVNDLDDPGNRGLFIIGWRYSDNPNPILLDD